MSKEDKAKLDLLPAETSFARTTTVLGSAVSAGTAITVPCEAGSGASAQCVDYSSTSIKLNCDIPAGDTITAAAVAVSAS